MGLALPGVCEAQLIFADGFESGDTSAWSFVEDQANSPPNICLPAPAVVDENSMVWISPISISDHDIGSGELSATLAVSSGCLTLQSTNGLFFWVGDGDDDRLMEFTGTLDATNAAIGQILYVPDPDYWGADYLTVWVDDQGNTGSGGSQTDLASLEITVNPATP